MKKVGILYGLGGQIFDPPAGQRLLAERLTEKGFEVGGPYKFWESAKLYAFIERADFRAIVGDSLGACYGPLYASQMKPLEFDYVAGFQPSVYGYNVHNGEILVPDNIRVAHCIRDPIWSDTMGLGYATWVALNPGKTELTITLHRAAHPDDWGWSQDLVYNEIIKLASG